MLDAGLHAGVGQLGTGRHDVKTVRHVFNLVEKETQAMLALRDEVSGVNAAQRSVLHSGVVLEHVGVCSPQDMDVLVDVFLQLDASDADPEAEVDALQLLKAFRALPPGADGQRVSTPSTRASSAASSPHSSTGAWEVGAQWAAEDIGQSAFGKYSEAIVKKVWDLVKEEVQFLLNFNVREQDLSLPQEERDLQEADAILECIGVESQEDVDALVGLFYRGQELGDESLEVGPDDVMSLLQEFMAQKEALHVQGAAQDDAKAAAIATGEGTEGLPEMASPMPLLGASHFRRLQSLRLQRWEAAAREGS